MNKKEQVTWVGYFLPTPLTESFDKRMAHIGFGFSLIYSPKWLCL
jgi:hypothetical protein